jgi:uncharacterized caspase-like protein
VTVEVSSAKGVFQKDGRALTMSTGVHDLRLFRDGQLVGQWPEPKPGGGGLRNGTNLTQPDLKAWRAATHIDAVPKTGRARRTFSVRLPHGKAGQRVTFSAYAFNVDRVKSTTATQDYIIPNNLKLLRPRAYILSMGVNAYENPQWDLRFAVSDATLMQQALNSRLGKHYEVVPIKLVSDYEVMDGERKIRENHATKAALRAVLRALAGQTGDNSALAGVASAEKLRRAEPDDLLLITVSSHGYTDANGLFYLVPSDSGNSDGQKISAELIAKWVSSDELSEWLRKIDASDIVMIVDTCHSAATVDSPGFKPGPMGSRGLGQLAYDKGMSVLAASQANDVALESDKIKQGLLTYALVHDALEQGKAGNGDANGQISLDAWLQYGVDRVPQLYDDLREGRVSRDTGIDEQMTNGTSSLRRPETFQQPSLFSFKRQTREVFLRK